MKYDVQHPPLACLQTESACYKGTKPMTVRGVLWHSTGANNPNLCRYIQPTDDADDREAMLELLGTNKYGNDYNHGSKTRQMGVNAWIGKLASGAVAAVQALPWGWKPWGCGAGTKGSCNDGWIQFEICEDNLKNPEYATAVYHEACELTAFLCTAYHLDPLGTVSFKGVKVPTIIDHRTSHLLGLGNNHGDVQHWFPSLIGKTLEDIRNDVTALMNITNRIEYTVEPIDSKNDTPAPAPASLGARTLRRGMEGSDVEELQRALLWLGYSLPKFGADGDYGAETVTAVKAFQSDHNLTADGIFGPASLAALSALLTSQTPEATDTPAEETPFKIRVTGGAVNIRSQPFIADNNIVGLAKQGNILKSVGMDDSGDWYKLDDGNYISATYAFKIKA